MANKYKTRRSIFAYLICAYFVFVAVWWTVSVVLDPAWACVASGATYLVVLQFCRCSITLYLLHVIFLLSALLQDARSFFDFRRPGIFCAVCTRVSIKYIENEANAGFAIRSLYRSMYGWRCIRGWHLVECFWLVWVVIWVVIIWVVIIWVVVI